jgi:TorA maturation chaperone TorD
VTDTRDGGLKLAIEAAGGIGSLARALGISQPSVSNWSRIPTERLPAVESLTGIPRTRLRPDLYPEGTPDWGDPLDQARGAHYLLLAHLLRVAPTSTFLRQLISLRVDASPLGLATAALVNAARATSEQMAGREFFNLFIGVGGCEVLPYESYYRTGFLNDRPLARLREDLAKLGIERAPGHYEPEDHLGIVFETMGGLLIGALPGSGDDAEEFFRRHVDPWADRCMTDIASAPSATFYRAVGAFGRTFIAIEMEAYALPA